MTAPLWTAQEREALREMIKEFRSGSEWEGVTYTEAEKADRTVAALIEALKARVISCECGNGSNAMCGLCLNDRDLLDSLK